VQFNLTTKILAEIKQPPPSPLPPTQQSCSVDVSRLLSKLQNPPVDPLAANQMIFPLEEAKQVLTQVASEPGCFAQKQSLCQPVQFYWDRYILLRSRSDEMTGSDSQRSICRSGCFMTNSSQADIYACQDRCETDYQRSIQSSGQKQSSEKQRKGSFLSSVGCS